CLIAGYADQNRTIDVSTVDEAIDYLEERERPTPEPRRPLRRPEPPRDPSSKPREREMLAAPVPVAPQPEVASRQGTKPQPFRAVDTSPAPKVEEAEGNRPLSEAFSPAKVEAFSPTKAEAFSPAKAPSDRWMVSAGMAAAAGSAVLLALAPSLAL